MRTRSLADFDLSKLEDVSLDISAIRCSCQCWSLTKIHRTGGLIAFHGDYRLGSAGADDAQYIKWRINEFCDLSPYHISGLILDCRALNYEWGDDLYLDASTKPHGFPTLVVLNDPQRKPFSYAVRSDQMRFDLTQALAEMNDIFRAMKPLL